VGIPKSIIEDVMDPNKCFFNIVVTIFGNCGSTNNVIKIY
jgi:hypothetical protein